MIMVWFGIYSMISKHILLIKCFSDVGWFVVFYGISTFVGYLTPNTFLCK